MFKLYTNITCSKFQVPNNNLFKLLVLSLFRYFEKHVCFESILLTHYNIVTYLQHLIVLQWLNKKYQNYYWIYYLPKLVLNFELH